MRHDDDDDWALKEMIVNFHNYAQFLYKYAEYLYNLLSLFIIMLIFFIIMLSNHFTTTTHGWCHVTVDMTLNNLFWKY